MKTDGGYRIHFENEDSDFFRLLWNIRKRNLFVVVVGSVVISGLFAFYAAFNKPIDASNDRRWIVYLLPLILPLFVVVVSYLSLRKQVKKMKDTSNSVVAYYDREGIELSGNHTTAKSAWQSFHRVVETNDDFIFYVQRDICYAIPKRFFDSSDEIHDLRNFLKDSISERVLLQSE